MEVSKSVEADVGVGRNYRALKFVLELTGGCRFGVIRAAGSRQVGTEGELDAKTAHEAQLEILAHIWNFRFR